MVEGNNTRSSGVSFPMRTIHILYAAVLFSLVLMPFTSLFWRDDFFFIKLNWLSYPIIILGILNFVFQRKAFSKYFLVYLGLAFFYLIVFIFWQGDIEAYFRLFVAVLPFVFLPYFDELSFRSVKTFFIFYFILLLPSLYIGYLQTIGQVPYEDFDYINGVAIGRMSGGYSKPMNLIAFLFPIYLLGFYLILIQGRKLVGLLIIVVILGVLYQIGHRTSLAAFIFIAIASLFRAQAVSVIYYYYRYLVGFFVGSIAFLFFYFLKMQWGIIDAVRGRVAMWENHSEKFFNSNILGILFGKQVVKIEDLGDPLVVRYDEVHNNSFRTIILFGLFGYLVYCIFMRWVVTSTYWAQTDPNKRFIAFSSFIYFIFYTVTNEPFYYGSVVWPILIWVFLLRDKPDATSVCKEN